MSGFKSVSFRLSLVVGLAIALLLGGTGFLLTGKTDDVIHTLGEENLKQLVTSAAGAVDAYNEELESGAKRLSAVFGKLFPGDFEGRQTNVKISPQIIYPIVLIKYSHRLGEGRRKPS
ncbi:hypothetical protein QQM79_02810 [Marinobacteraceae bacterium S3BR75-40.1]